VKPVNYIKKMYNNSSSSHAILRNLIMMEEELKRLFLASQ